MIKAYILTEKINQDDLKACELIGEQYEPPLEYSESWINEFLVSTIISTPKKDVYIVSLPEADITAKIHKDEIAKL